jgi:hypothetical protein
MVWPITGAESYVCETGKSMKSMGLAVSQKDWWRNIPITVRRDSAVKLIDGLAGESPASASCPVGTVVISGDGAGDQTVGSPDVKVLDGWTQVWSAPTGGQAKQQVVPQANRSQASKTHPQQDRSVRIKGMPKLFYPRLRARVFGEALGKSIRRVPRGLRGRHVVKVAGGRGDCP